MPDGIDFDELFKKITGQQKPPPGVAVAEHPPIEPELPKIEPQKPSIELYKPFSRIPREGLKYTIEDELGKSHELTVMEDFEFVGTEPRLRSLDYVVFSEGKKVGTFDFETEKFKPVDIPWWQTAMKWVFAPATIVGTSLHGMFVPPKLKAAEKQANEWYMEELKKLQIELFGKELGAVSLIPKEKKEEYLKRVGMLAEERIKRGGLDIPAKERRVQAQYEALPWYAQMAWELPFWLGLSASGLSALRGFRAAAALPTAARIPAQVALAPLAGYEWAVGKVISTTIEGTYGIVMRSVLRRNLHSWAISAGVEIPRATEDAFINSAVANLRPQFMMKEAIKTLFKSTKAGYTVTDAGVRAAEEAASQAVRTSPLLLGLVKPAAPLVTPPIMLPAAVPTAITTAMMERLPINATSWTAMSIADKVALVKSLGLEGKVGSKSWGALTNAEIETLTRAPITPPVTPVVPEVTIPKAEVGMPEAVAPPPVAPTAIPKVAPEAPKVAPTIGGLQVRKIQIKELLATPAKELPKGVTKIALRRELSDINKILESGEIARPIKVHGKIVLKASTEKNIQTLKDILVAERKMTPEIYERLKKDLKLPTDRFESASRFITESEAKNLIRQMNYEAESGIAEWDARVSEALANKPELKSVIDDISSRIVKAQPEVRLQRNINWRKYAIEISEVPRDVRLSGTMAILRALRRFQEQLGGREATRIYDVAEKMIETRRLNDVTHAQRVSAMKGEVPELLRITKNKPSIEKIQKWLDSDLKVAKIEKPELTPDELKVAQLFRREYDQWKDTVRLERFKDAYYHYRGNAELIKSGTERTGEVAIPDAPLSDIKEAISIYESGGETALANYLKTKDWGVLKSGYSYAQVIHPQLRLGQRYAVRATTTSLHQRKGLDFDRDERTAWERLVAYERQMIGLNLQPYFRKMDMEFRHIVELGKLSNPSADANTISLFLQEVKGFPIESPVARILLRIGGWSFGTLAKVPWMSVRNLHQNIAFHPDKAEIGKAIFTGGFYANPLTRSGRLDYTDALVHQFKGVMQEQLLMGYMGRTPIENLIRKTDYYHLSDKLNRFLSMAGSGAKAERALGAYLRTGDVQQFLKDSGANELSQTEQLRILEYLALDNYDYGGVLDTVSGGEAAIRNIANGITTLNHFNYIRYLRSSVEMGELGRVIGSLVAFPRSVAERYVDVFSRLSPRKGLTGDTRKRAIHSLLALVIGSGIASASLAAITGKKRDAYNPFLILQWQVGGLAIGATENLTELYRHLTNLTFAKEERDKQYAMEQLAILIPSLGDSFIPFYAPTMNILESLTDSRYLDRQTLRKLRAMFDEHYKPNEEFYKIERTLLEKIQHGLFGTRTPDPTDLEVTLKKLKGITEGLGQIDEEALNKARQRAAEANMPFEYEPEDYIYRTNNMGSDINSAIYGLDPSEITLENGFSPLVLDYMEYQEWFKKYQVVPADKRYDYRAENPELDAYLFFWGYVTTIQSDTARQLIEQMIGKYNIPPRAIRGYEKLEAGTSPRTKPSGKIDFDELFRKITGQ